MTATAAPNSHSIPAAPPQRAKSRLRMCLDWLLAGTHPEPDDIRSELLHQRAGKTKTLAVAIFASLLTAVIAAALTGATWAYAWMAAEMALGSIRVYLLLKDVAKAKAAQRTGTNMAPIWAGLASVFLITAGCYQCVASGVLPLILMAGIGIANLVGGISSRNAGTPRYGALLICILTLPFGVATILSPIPYLFLVGLQTPLYTAGMIFLLIENHKGLLNLHRSEHRNRLMAHHDLLTGLPNRAMNQKLFAELLAAPEPASPNSKLTVFCLDLDGFKAVNDGLGHATGDAVLVEVPGVCAPACARSMSPAASAATSSLSCCRISRATQPSRSPGASSPRSPPRSNSPPRQRSASASASPPRPATATPPTNCSAPPTARCTKPNAAARAGS